MEGPTSLISDLEVPILLREEQKEEPEVSFEPQLKENGLEAIPQPTELLQQKVHSVESKSQVSSLDNISELPKILARDTKDVEEKSELLTPSSFLHEPMEETQTLDKLPQLMPIQSEEKLEEHAGTTQLWIIITAIRRRI